MAVCPGSRLFTSHWHARGPSRKQTTEVSRRKGSQLKSVTIFGMHCNWRRHQGRTDAPWKTYTTISVRLGPLSLEDQHQDKSKLWSLENYSLNIPSVFLWSYCTELQLALGLSQLQYKAFLTYNWVSELITRFTVIQSEQGLKHTAEKVSTRYNWVIKEIWLSMTTHVIGRRLHIQWERRLGPSLNVRPYRLTDFNGRSH